MIRLPTKRSILSASIYLEPIMSLRRIIWRITGDLSIKFLVQRQKRYQFLGTRSHSWKVAGYTTTSFGIRRIGRRKRSFQPRPSVIYNFWILARKTAKRFRPRKKRARPCSCMNTWETRCVSRVKLLHCQKTRIDTFCAHKWLALVMAKFLRRISTKI